MEPNPCPTAPHGSHTSGVSYFALLGLACQQRRNQALEARCSGSANILGKGLQGKEGDGAIELHPISLFQQHRFISDLQCTITGNGAHFVHASVRQGFPVSQWCSVSCVRGGRSCRPTGRQRLSPNLNQCWTVLAQRYLEGEGKGKFSARPSMSPKRHLALCVSFPHAAMNW